MESELVSVMWQKRDFCLGFRQLQLCFPHLKMQELEYSKNPIHFKI